jgi:hypothetical protein
MKKLEKLVLQDVTQIPEIEQKTLYGGSGYLIINGTILGYFTDDAYATPGFMTNLCDLQGMQNHYNDVGSTSSLFAKAVSIFSLLCGLPFGVGSGCSLFLGLDGSSNDSRADNLGAAIDVLQSKGYINCDTTFRFYNDDGFIRIFDYTGECLVGFNL